jgi:colicin V production protein
MKLGNYIDIAITVFLIFSLVMGFRNGLIKSLFISFGFVIKIGLTYMVYTFFKDVLLDNEAIKVLLSMIRKPMIEKLPNLALITPVVDNVILVLLIYIIATIFIFLLFHMLKDLMSQDMLSLSDKILGALFSGLKSVIVIMIIVYALDIISDTVLSKSTKDLLSQSFLLPKFFYYNIFMWIGK